jgi:hypothetical protein
MVLGSDKALIKVGFMCILSTYFLDEKHLFLTYFPFQVSLIWPLRIIIGRKYKACIQDMSVFEFYSKTECSEFDIRQVFAELHWGVLWKITRLPTDVGWRVLVHYATMTKVVADQVWVRGWNVKKLK